MNRIATRSEETVHEFSSRLSLDFDNETSTRSSARINTCIPLHYESRYAYPVIIWLPGRGESEESIAEVMPLVSLRNFVGAAIRGPLVGKTGIELPVSWDLSSDGVEIAAEAVEHCIQTLKMRFNIAESRIFLAGYADGGTMALRIGMSYPGLAAGAASLGGSFPKGGAPLSRIKQSRALEVLLAHGRDSEAYTEEAVCDDLRLLHYAGINVTLRQYPHGDQLSDHMLADLNRWAMQLVTGPQESKPSVQPFEVN